MSARVDAINAEWGKAASDNVVSNSELRRVYDAARVEGVSNQALSAVDAIVARELKLQHVIEAQEKARWAAFDAANTALRDGEAAHLPKPDLARLRAAVDSARAERDKKSDEQMKQFDVARQALKLSRMLREDRAEQSLVDMLWANIKAL